MIYIGIDPGLTGAVASYGRGRILAVADMPTTQRTYGHGREVDWKKFRDVMMQISSDSSEDYFAVVENVGVMPKQGAVSGFQFGQVMGGIKAVLDCMYMEWGLIHPATWKKRFGLVGSDKDATRQMILQAYPDTIDWLKLAKHHNRADAMAIAIAGDKV
jgi:Holliday junction resolvasome RuvABC endonuclease subunit